MSIKALLTYRFERNVGTLDRVLRVASGVAVVALGWLVTLPPWISLPLTAVGVAWSATGFAGRCGIYYLLGLSTCRASEEAT